MVKWRRFVLQKRRADSKGRLETLPYWVVVNSWWCRISGKIGEVANFEHLLLPLYFLYSRPGRTPVFVRTVGWGNFTLLSMIKWRKFLLQNGGADRKRRWENLPY